MRFQLAQEGMQQVQETMGSALQETAVQHWMNQIDFYQVGTYLLTDPNISQVKHKIVGIGQDLAIAAAGVMTVAAGLFIIIGLKREGMRRFMDQVQGLAVSLIGPAVIAGIAIFFIGIAKNISI